MDEDTDGTAIGHAPARVRAMDVANELLAAHGTRIPLTNQRINKLVYLAQVEALRRDGAPLYDDPIEAWDDGPAIPTVHEAFSAYGTNQIAKPTYAPPRDARMRAVTARVAERYGHLSVYDLIRLAHRPGGAWGRAHRPGRRATITPALILAASDTTEPDLGATFSACLRQVDATWPRTITLLERS
ncbi:MAG: DUF4065 domain-containing protein [Bifidobacterium sp.]|nr:DUF4065 domain-containing protein [Bifidobacterium sp.]